MPTQTDKILFNLPVTKQWLEQYALFHHTQSGASYRDITDSFNILFDFKRSVGWVHDTLYKHNQTVQSFHQNEDLSKIKVSANDEMFNKNKPILTGVCTNSLYCPILQKSDDRKAETWKENIDKLAVKGYSPNSVILDGLSSLQLGHTMALPNANIIYDTFHITSDFNDLSRFTRNRFKSTKTNMETIQSKYDKAKNPDKIQALKKQLRKAKKDHKEANYIHQSISTLNSWLQHDILKVAGYDYSTRLELLNFIIEQLQAIEHKLPHRIGPVRKNLQKNAEKIIGFVWNLEQELQQYADELGIDVYWLWQICYAQKFSKCVSNYYQFISKTKKRLKHHFYQVERSVIAIMNEIDKASSVVENLNGRIRKYLINHIHVSQPMLDLLRFALNHTVFNRSRCEHRHKKSPSEVLHQSKHQHWLEMLGYKLFKQAA
jgi:hypothetical protein